MKALIIKPGATAPEPLELSDRSHKEIHEAIGNYFSQCFHIHTGAGHVLGFCDDEFLLTNRDDWSCFLGDTLRQDAPYPVAGPVVIVGHDGGGETRSLTENEVSHFTLAPKWLRLPLLQWEG